MLLVKPERIWQDIWPNAKCKSTSWQQNDRKKLKNENGRYLSTAQDSRGQTSEMDTLAMKEVGAADSTRDSILQHDQARWCHSAPARQQPCHGKLVPRQSSVQKQGNDWANHPSNCARNPWETRCGPWYLLAAAVVHCCSAKLKVQYLRVSGLQKASLSAGPLPTRRWTPHVPLWWGTGNGKHEVDCWRWASFSHWQPSCERFQGAQLVQSRTGYKHLALQRSLANTSASGPKNGLENIHEVSGYLGSFCIIWKSWADLGGSKLMKTGCKMLQIPGYIRKMFWQAAARQKATNRKPARKQPRWCSHSCRHRYRPEKRCEKHGMWWNVVEDEVVFRYLQLPYSIIIYFQYPPTQPIAGGNTTVQYI